MSRAPEIWSYTHERHIYRDSATLTISNINLGTGHFISITHCVAQCAKHYINTSAFVQSPFKFESSSDHSGHLILVSKVNENWQYVVLRHVCV